MKNVLLLAFALILGGSLMAQDSEKKVIIIKKNKDGSISKIEKAVNPDENTVIYIREGSVNGLEGEELHLKMKDLEGKLSEMKIRGLDAEKMKKLEKEMGQLREIRINRGNYTYRHRDDGERRLVPERAVKAFLGVVAGDHAGDKGFRANRVVEGSGAEAGGLERGDIVLSISNNPTDGSGGLTGVLARYQPNDQVTLEILRDGQPMTLNVTLGEKEYTRYVYNEDYNPCPVFIGVYTTDNMREEGVRVTSIIGNTAAETYGVNAGDRILALDGVEVATGSQLRYERDKHEPGEEFTLLVNRGGNLIDIQARFKSCPEQLNEDVADEVVEEIADQPLVPVEVAPSLVPAEPTEAPRSLIDQPREMPTLELQRWQAYPNPSLGDITIEFQAEPVPTTLRVIDASGKVIYKEQINNFDGIYKKELNLRTATPGTLLLSIQQEEKVVTKQLVLMNKA